MNLAQMAHQDIIDRLNETGSNTALRLLANRRLTRGPLDRVAQMADRKYCRPHARPFRLGLP